MHLSFEPPDKDTTRRLLGAPWIAMDTEFDGPRVLPNPSRKDAKGNRPMPCQRRAELVGFSLWAPCVGEEWPEGVYVPINYQGDERGARWSWLYNFLRAYDGVVWFHNALADITVLTNSHNGLPMPKRLGDTMVLAWLLGKREPGKKKGLNLDSLIRKDLGVAEGKSFQETFQGKGASEVSPEAMAPYAARDAWYTGRLADKYMGELEWWPKLAPHFWDCEMPLVRTVHQMYVTGVPVDKEALKEADDKLLVALENTKESFRSLTETWVELPVKQRVETGEFYKNGNPKMKTVEVLEPQLHGAVVTSDAQVRRWLYDELAWWPKDTVHRTDTGEPSVDSTTVKSHLFLTNPPAVEAARLRLRANKLSKLRGTYVHPFPLYAEASGDGRVHANIHQTGTETGRFSSSHPNMQNLPRPAEDYFGLTLPNIRAAIVPAKGNVFIGADYSQLELRIVAHLSQDENLCRAFNEGLDPHQMTMDKVKAEYGLTISRVLAKITNFSTIYRISARSLGVKLGLPKEEAAKIIKAFYKQYPRIRDYHSRAVTFARKHNYIHALGGFVRHLAYPEGACARTNSREPQKQWCGCEWCRKASHEDNKAINTPVQSSAGVIMKRAMVALYNEWRGTDNRILMQVHDELLCEIPDGVDRSVRIEQLCKAMENAMELRVPLVAEGKIGYSWAELK